MTVWVRVVVAGAACVGLLAGCSSSGSSTGPASSSSSGSSATGGSATGGSATTVDVKGYAFAPGNITVAKGTTVTWKFEDPTKHNVTSSTNAFTSTDLSAGGSYSHTFNTAGTYNYICSIHQFMKGTVTVK